MSRKVRVMSILGSVLAVALFATLVISTSGAGSTPTHNLAALSVSATEQFYRGYLSPPGATQPTVGAQAAYSTASGYSPGTYSSSKEEFGLFTDTVIRPEASSGSIGPLTFQNVPAWVVTFYGECPPENGGPLASPPASPPPPPPASSCTLDYHVVINANTGAFVESFGDPR